MWILVDLEEPVRASSRRSRGRIGAEGDEATGPTDFDAKRDQADMIAREAWEARGYEAGYAEGLADEASTRADSTDPTGTSSAPCSHDALGDGSGGVFVGGD